MGRTSAFFLRLCVIATAIVMLILSVRAVRAQDGVPAMRGSQALSNPASPISSSNQVYGYNQDQGLPRQSTPALQARPVSYAAAPPPIQQAQPAYGYKPGEGIAGPQHYGTQSDVAPISQTPITQSPITQAPIDQPPSNQVIAAVPRLNADYRLGSGDKVRVTVYGESDLSGDYQIDGTGIVRLPLIGALRAAGYTAQALETGIGMALAKGFLKNPRVNVEIITYRPFYIIGSVNRPGEYPYIDHISALNAVALAGGFTEAARQSTVYVRHEGSTVEEEMPTDELSELRPGDTIRVKTTLFWQAMQFFTPLTPAIYAAATIR